MNRIILHIDMDAFFPAIEERENPQFKGMPIIVGADPKDGKGRGVVSSASYEARKYGIHSAMPISIAYELCPEAIFLPVNMELYQNVSESIMKIIRKYSSIVETLSLDEAFLDLTTFSAVAGKSDETNNWERTGNLAKKLKEEIFEKEKLTSTVGIGPNKLIAKMASKTAKPDGLLIIKPNQVKKFLEPLNIEDLPGIGPKTGMRIALARPLASRNANEPMQIRDLKKFTRQELIELLGKIGGTIHERARGIDETPVTSRVIIKSIGKEHTFEKDTRNPDLIFGKFDKIINEVYNEISSGNFHFKTITVICRFQGFETHTKSKTLKTPIQDSEILKKEAKKLLLKFLIESKKFIRLVGLRVKIC